MGEMIREAMEGAYVERHYHGNSFVVSFVVFFAEMFWSWLMDVTVCRWFGHDLVEDGYAGPDSGCMEFECRRCGWFHRHILY